jgi:DNA-binding response OmpR family regulator
MSLLIETRRELEKVRHELDELTAKRDSEAVPFAMLFLIPRQLAHILCAAHSNPVVSRDEIMAIIAHTGRTGWGQSIKVVDVAVWRLNKRLEAHGLRIKNLRGVGFYLTDEDKRTITALLSSKL